MKGCVTFGGDWEEALANAEDVLAGWLAHAEPKFIKKPSTHEQLKGLPGELVPVVVNENIVDSYKEMKRFNVIFPSNILKAVDDFRKCAGLKRSTFLQRAAEAYLQNYHK